MRATTCQRTSALIRHHARLTNRVHLAGRQLRGEPGYRPIRPPHQPKEA